MPTCLDLFFEFEWHNFLHNLVKSLLDMIVKGENEAFKRSLFTDANILSRIVDAHKKVSRSRARDAHRARPEVTERCVVFGPAFGSCLAGAVGSVGSRLWVRVTGSDDDVVGFGGRTTRQ